MQFYIYLLQDPSIPSPIFLHSRYLWLMYFTRYSIFVLPNICSFAQSLLFMWPVLDGIRVKGGGPPSTLSSTLKPQAPTWKAAPWPCGREKAAACKAILHKLSHDWLRSLPYYHQLSKLMHSFILVITYIFYYKVNSWEQGFSCSCWSSLYHKCLHTIRTQYGFVGWLL